MSAYEATGGENPLITHDFGNCYFFYGTLASLRFPQLKKLFYADPAQGDWHTPITERVVQVPLGDDPYVKEFQHFARVIRGEEAARCSGGDARTTLAVTVAIQQSGEKGQPVRLA